MIRKISHIILIIFLLVVGIHNTKAQHFFVNTNVKFNVPAGVYVRVPGNVVTNTNSIINNNGNIFLTGDFINNANVVSGNGSNVKLEGALQNVGGTNSTTFDNLIIDGTDNKTISIQTKINNTLIYNANHVIIGNNNLVLLQNAGIAGAFNDKYVVTNGSGSLIKKSVPLASDFLFPVGDALSSYKPIILNYGGVTDTFAVRVEAGVNPTTGTDPVCVQYTYIIEESDIGGSDASLSLGWNTQDEGSSFNRTIAYMWQNNNIWNLLQGVPGAESNFPATDWYYKTSGITDFSSDANKFIIREKAATDIFVPNIFSPNDDGQNDILFVRGAEIKEIKFVVYNRWGEKVFESNDIKHGWDGTYKGKKLSTAVFTYYVKTTYYDGKIVKRKGNVTLIR